MNKSDSKPDLPVYYLFGASSSRRREFIQRLRAVFESRSLLVSLAKRQDCLAAGCHEEICRLRMSDLLLVDTGRDLKGESILLCGPEGSPQDGLSFGDGDDRTLEQFADRLIGRLATQLQRIPVWACILIGGKSSRMGRPKHLIKEGKHRSWLERTVEILRPLVDGLVVSGTGRLPEPLAGMVRLPDIPGVAGPLTGILSACRWQPLVSWLLVACDMPYISPEAVEWLLSERRIGCWGLVPRLAGKEHCEPLFAWYDFRAGPIFEQQLLDDNLRIGSIASHAKIDTPQIPDSLRGSWQNINTPEQLSAT